MAPIHWINVLVVECDAFCFSSANRWSMSSTNKLPFALKTRWPEDKIIRRVLAEERLSYLQTVCLLVSVSSIFLILPSIKPSISNNSLFLLWESCKGKIVTGGKQLNRTLNCWLIIIWVWIMLSYSKIVTNKIAWNTIFTDRVYTCFKYAITAFF